jgi:hypothetical protein
LDVRVVAVTAAVPGPEIVREPVVLAGRGELQIDDLVLGVDEPRVDRVLPVVETVEI